MNKFYLPKLKRLIIENFSLYECPLNIDFSKKLSIIFGTNGTGKSTLLMIILFSIIGPYRGGIKTKTRKNQRKDNRPFYDEDFFRDRAVEKTEEAKVISFFKINKDEYIVEHSLYDGKLLKVDVNGNQLEGKTVTYRTYESKFSRVREIDKDDDGDLKSYLIYKYQKAIRKSTCLPGGVNTLISMLLDVMFFDEGRSFTFWNPSLQETIIGKYIVDDVFYEDYCEKKLDSKALESAYKKKSETLNYMKKFFESEKQEVNENKDEEMLRVELLNIDEKIYLLDKELIEKRNKYNERSDNSIRLSQKVEELQELIKKLDEKWYSNLLPNQYNSFYKKFTGKMIQNICPICGSTHIFDMDTSHCIFCHENLKIEKKTDIIDIDIKRKDYQLRLSSKSEELKLIQKEMSNLSDDVSTLRKKLEDKKMQKQKIEISLDPHEESQDNDSKRLERAAAERNLALEDYNKCKKEESIMRKEIEQSLVNNFKEFSSSFVKFVYSFFGEGHKVNVELPFSKFDEDIISDEELMIEFILDGKARNSSYMLSESQRIFTDLAFRFAILTTFHENSFFMCETPDSTLDVFHEANAVNTFKRYLEAGNTLVLTANVRKSNLIAQLYSQVEKEDITIIDLTKLSKIRLPLEVDFDDYLGGMI